MPGWQTGNSGTTRAVHRTTIPQAGHQMITEYALLDESDAKKKKKKSKSRSANEQELLLAKRNCKNEFLVGSKQEISTPIPGVFLHPSFLICFFFCCCSPRLRSFVEKMDICSPQMCFLSTHTQSHSHISLLYILRFDTFSPASTFVSNSSRCGTCCPSNQ
jgi:hypothetical protein